HHRSLQLQSSTRRKDGSIKRSFAGEEIDIRNVCQEMSQYQGCVGMLAPLQQSRIWTADNPGIRRPLVKHSDSKALGRQTDNDFFHCEILRIGVILVRKGRSEDGDHRAAIIFGLTPVGWFGR